MKRLVIVLIILIGFPAGCIIAGRIRDQRIIAANPIEIRCHVVGKPSKNGPLVDFPVALSITNRSDKPIDTVEVMFYTDISGAAHLPFKALAAHTSQTRTVPLETIAEDHGPLKCEDYIVVYSDGSEWKAPFRGPYLP